MTYQQQQRIERHIKAMRKLTRSALDSCASVWRECGCGDAGCGYYAADWHEEDMLTLLLKVERFLYDTDMETALLTLGDKQED